MIARRLTVLAMLTAAWCVLWGNISVANVLSGIAVALAIDVLGLGTAMVGGVRVVPLLRLAWMVAVDLFRSTMRVAIELLTLGDNTAESIVAVELGPESRHHFLLLTVVVTITPGTTVVDTDPDTGTVYLHLLHSGRRAGTVAHLRELLVLARKAFPLPNDAPPGSVNAIEGGLT